MPEEEVIERARRDEAHGKSTSTQASEFVREEMHHVREGKHGARSPQQAIAIGLSKARRAGVKLPPPKKGIGSQQTREKALQDLRKGRRSNRSKTSRTRSEAVLRALKREGHSAASRSNLSHQGHVAAQRRARDSRHRAAMRAVRTKGHSGLRRAARKAASRRARHRPAA
jgi:hypothetical protein